VKGVGHVHSGWGVVIRVDVGAGWMFCVDNATSVLACCSCGDVGWELVVVVVYACVGPEQVAAELRSSLFAMVSTSRWSLGLDLLRRSPSPGVPTFVVLNGDSGLGDK